MTFLGIGSWTYEQEGWKYIERFLAIGAAYRKWRIRKRHGESRKYGKEGTDAELEIGLALGIFARGLQSVGRGIAIGKLYDSKVGAKKSDSGKR